MLPLPFTLNTADLTALVGQWFWPMTRIAAAVWAMPMFGGSGLPKKARLALVLSLTFLIFPNVGNIPVTEPFSVQSLLITLQQVGIGLAFGFILKLWLTVFTMGGQIMSMQMGLAMAVMNDPVNGAGTAVLGKWIQTLAMLAFLAMDGHLVVFAVLLDSFTTLPIGIGFPNDFWMDLVKLGSWLFASSLLVALPVVISMLLVNLAFGVMNRAAPQLNIIALGFPMTMMFGMATVYLAMTSLPGMLVNLTTEGLIYLRLLVGG
ncbi:flagellar biosynthetic protein FliR [Sansalvadorimonas sp. 2012CJ34-2]|uniref:Flagellar biosynthetic protein FliR n=1 Tax=Parendozoicomonas callyspongiae TaxID=2942213 RepID=A0ABT0PFI7_9GAMM|nr:flagellar biosynthetic protein FliR [Sansalvadorimonas sp. 2012CJ34-2]MCL6270134.1 flagellar biosynthetic protein FliR [Sansalvadorimonas sp. 2012CJ34-2]